MLNTPYYLIDEYKLKKNLEVIGRIKDLSGARFLLALKCFSTWSVFDLMKRYLDGTTSSSLYEAELGYEKFGKETHAYCVGYSDSDIDRLVEISDKFIFNSISQLERFYERVKNKKIGLRVNPGISNSGFDLADPSRRYSRLGVININEVMGVRNKISGLMLHFNCENADFNSLKQSLLSIEKSNMELFRSMEWLSIGGGIAFTNPEYPVEEFALFLRDFSERNSLQIYLEPGEAVVTGTTELVTSVVDIVTNEIKIAVVDASIEAHCLDLLIYRTAAKFLNSENGLHSYQVAGRSCLAGDVFGTIKTDQPLSTGDQIRIQDCGGYTMVKKNWFNGVSMPAIAVKRLDGSITVVRKFGYEDFKNCLS